MLYLIEDRKFIKIGYAKNIENRLEQYKLHNCYFKLVYTKPGNLHDERAIHKLCEKYRYYHEWYHNRKKVKEIFLNYTSTEIDQWNKTKSLIDLIGNKIINSYETNNNYIPFKLFLNELQEEHCLDIEYIRSHLGDYSTSNIDDCVEQYQDVWDNIYTILTHWRILPKNYKLTINKTIYIENNHYNNEEYHEYLEKVKHEISLIKPKKNIFSNIGVNLSKIHYKSKYSF